MTNNVNSAYFYENYVILKMSVENKKHTNYNILDASAIVRHVALAFNSRSFQYYETVIRNIIIRKSG